MVFTSVNADNVSQRKFLLSVDSNKSSSSSIKALLKQFRYKVWSAGTAAEALDVCDIVMPALVIVRKIEDMPLVDFIGKIKRLDTSRQVTVLVIANGKDAVDERACLTAGAFTCLRMPLNMETLYRTIQVAIEPVPRMNIRINAALPVMINNAAPGSTNGKFATSLSESGLFVMTPEPCPLNTRVPLLFKIAGKVVSADAVVLYSQKKGNRTHSRPGMGLQFVRISDHDQEHIRRFIREEVKKAVFASQRTDSVSASLPQAQVARL